MVLGVSHVPPGEPPTTNLLQATHQTPQPHPRRQQQNALSSLPFGRTHSPQKQPKFYLISPISIAIYSTLRTKKELHASAYALQIIDVVFYCKSVPKSLMKPGPEPLRTPISIPQASHPRAPSFPPTSNVRHHTQSPTSRRQRQPSLSPHPSNSNSYPL